MKKEQNTIERVVLQCFIRIIKTNGKYMLYRSGVNNTGIMKAFVKHRKIISDNPFINASSNSEVAKILEQITNTMVSDKGGVKKLDKYEHVTMTINHLLHFFIESSGVAMPILCNFGEQIYNLSCNKLFGDELEEFDMEQSAPIEFESVKRVNKDVIGSGGGHCLGRIPDDGDGGENMFIRAARKRNQNDEYYTFDDPDDPNNDNWL